METTHQEDQRYANGLGQTYGQEAAWEATNDHDGGELTVEAVLEHDQDERQACGVAVPTENVPDVAAAFGLLNTHVSLLWSAFEDGVRDGIESWLDEADRAGAYDDEDDA